MLGKKSGKDSQMVVDALIGSQVTIRGDVEFAGGLYVEGRVIGRLVAREGEKALLTVAENGIIEGEIVADTVIISGRLTGDVHASERIELTATARVDGNVHYSVVEMAAGAQLTGRLIHASQAEPARAAKPAKVANA